MVENAAPPKRVSVTVPADWIGRMKAAAKAADMSVAEWRKHCIRRGLHAAEQRSVSEHRPRFSEPGASGEPPASARPPSPHQAAVDAAVKSLRAEASEIVSGRREGDG